MEAHPHVGVLGSAYYVIDDTNEIIDQHNPLVGNAAVQWLALCHSPFCNPSVMMKAAQVRTAGFYQDGLFPAEDFGRVLALCKGANLTEILTSYRHSHGNSSTLQREYQQQAVTTIAKKHINQQMASDFLTLEEAAQLREWYQSRLPGHPIAADFALADKWLLIWAAFVEKHRLTRAEQRPLVYGLVRTLLLMVWRRQPGAGRLLRKLLRLAPLQVGRALFISNARRIKRCLQALRMRIC